jgi:hypothetical protein
LSEEAHSALFFANRLSTNLQFVNAKLIARPRSHDRMRRREFMRLRRMTVEQKETL